MTDIKLKFPEIDQTYAFLDLQTTDKGTVRRITGNIVTAILNPKYCQNQKIIDGQIIYQRNKIPGENYWRKKYKRKSNTTLG